MGAADTTRVASPGERRTSPVELLWDLVFVFAITEVSVLLGHHLSWGGVGRSLIVLALIWWAWSAFVWAANAHDSSSPTLQAALLLGLVLIFVAGLAVPHAYDDEGTLFACTYAGVRFLHLGLYADASRRGQAAWSAIAGFAATVTAGMALLIAGSFLDTTWRTALWAAAVAIDYAGPAWLTRERLRGLQQVAVAHFAERYGLFVIICLGESIISIGAGASGQPLDARLIAAMVAGLVITVGLWWTYFHRVAEEAERSLRTHHDPVLAAADAYSYLHLVMIAGIIVFAAGAKLDDRRQRGSARRRGAARALRRRRALPRRPRRVPLAAARPARLRAARGHRRAARALRRDGRPRRLGGGGRRGARARGRVRRHAHGRARGRHGNGVAATPPRARPAGARTARARPPRRARCRRTAAARTSARRAAAAR